MTSAIASSPAPITRGGPAVSTSALEARLLADRVRQCVPLRHPAFGKLLHQVPATATGDTRADRHRGAG